MERSKSVQSNKRLWTMRLSIAVGLAVLSPVLLLWAEQAAPPAMASPPVTQEARAMDPGSVITIGVAAVLGPPVPWLGWPQANAVQLAVDQTNAAGGIDIGGVAYTVALVTENSGCNPADAATAANALLDAGAVAVVGHSCSSASMAAQPIYDAAGVPMVSASASSIALTEGGYTTTFRVSPRDDSQAALMATCFRQWLGMASVAVVEWSGHEWSADTFVPTFIGMGGTLTSRRSVASTDEYTATLTAIQAEDQQHSAQPGPEYHWLGSPRSRAWCLCNRGRAGSRRRLCRGEWAPQ